MYSAIIEKKDNSALINIAYNQYGDGKGTQLSNERYVNGSRLESIP